MVTATIDARAELGLLDYLAIARKRWPWVLIPLWLLLILAYGYTATQPARYQATARVLLADTASQRTLDPSSQNIGFRTREMSNEISLAVSDKVESLVVAELGERPDVDITSETEADVLVFTAEAGQAQIAAEQANAWANMYIQVKRDEAVGNIAAATTSLQNRLEALRTERRELRAPLVELEQSLIDTAEPDTTTRLQREYDQLEADLSYELTLLTSQAEATMAGITELELQAELASVGEVRIVQVAAPPANSANAPLSRNLALAGVLGLLAGAGLALLAETRDTTIKTPADIQSITDVPVLASIPRAKKKDFDDLSCATLLDPDGIFADAYHKVRSSLEFVSLDREINSILITSPNPGEGKSTSASNLALALGSVGKRTILLDIDFRRATIHKMYGIEPAPGFSDLILHGAEVDQGTYSLAGVGSPDVLVVPTGSMPPNPAAFVGTRGFQTSLEWFESESDITVLDSPPVLAVSDTRTVAKYVDAVILTAMSGRTTKGEMVETISVLRQAGADIIGIVLVGVGQSDTYGRDYYLYRSDQADSSRNGRAESTNGHDGSRNGRAESTNGHDGSRWGRPRELAIPSRP